MYIYKITQPQIVASLRAAGDSNFRFHTRANNAKSILEAAGYIDQDQNLYGIMLNPAALNMSLLEREAGEKKVLGYEYKIRTPVLVDAIGNEVCYEPDQQTITPTHIVAPFTIHTSFLQNKYDPDNQSTVGKCNLLLRNATDANLLEGRLDYEIDLDKDCDVEKQSKLHEVNIAKDHKLEKFCQSIGWTTKDYENKYGDEVSPIFGANLLINQYLHHDRVTRDLLKQKYQEKFPDIKDPVIEIMYTAQSVYSNSNTPIKLTDKIHAITTPTKNKTRCMRGQFMNLNQVTTQILNENGYPAIVVVSDTTRFVNEK